MLEIINKLENANSIAAAKHFLKMLIDEFIVICNKVSPASALLLVNRNDLRYILVKIAEGKYPPDEIIRLLDNWEQDIDPISYIAKILDIGADVKLDIKKFSNEQLSSLFTEIAQEIYARKVIELTDECCAVCGVRTEEKATYVTKRRKINNTIGGILVPCCNNCRSKLDEGVVISYLYHRYMLFRLAYLNVVSENSLRAFLN